MQDWLNRIGLTLQFVALFFVTPEIIGEEKVRSMARTIWVEPISKSKDLLTRHRRRAVLIYAFTLAALVATAELWIPETFMPKSLTYFVYPTLAFGVSLVIARAFKLVGRGIAALANWIIDSPRTFLPVGAFIFTVGFILLIWATFIHAD